jgi:hypothetical protein
LGFAFIRNTFDPYFIEVHLKLMTVIDALHEARNDLAPSSCRRSAAIQAFAFSCMLVGLDGCTAKTWYPHYGMSR